MSAIHDQGRIQQEPRRALQPRRADVEALAEEAAPLRGAGAGISQAGSPLPPAGLNGQAPLPGARALRQAAALRLQRLHGNAYVARAIARERSGVPAVDSTLAAAVQRSVVQRATSFADAKRAIQQQTARWGTGEEAIYSAIRDCSDRPRLKVDADVQRWLSDELSGHELWKAQLLLEFGRESAFPQPIKEIWSATEGRGTDEEAIRRTLRRLSPEEARRVGTIPGLRDILRDELSGSDLRQTEQLLTGDYQRQIARHRANVAVVSAMINAMAQPSRRLEIRNTAEWLLPTAAGSTAKNELYVLTPTHDASARATAHGQSGKLAYFGENNKFPDASADYDLDIQSTRNLHYSGPNISGEHLGVKIWVHNPSASSGLEATLVHEVQHDADRHNREAGAGSAYGSPEEAWNRYKTEFRAYWVDRERSGFSAASGSAPGTPFDNARQRAIFRHMYGSSATDVYAVWLRPNYDHNTLVSGYHFKDLVHGYIRPEGVNLINSPRIDDFFLRLERCQRSHRDLTASPLRELVEQANALDAADRAYVGSHDAVRLRVMMQEHLSAGVLTRIATIVNGGSLPTRVGTEAPPEPTNTRTTLA